MKPFFLFLLAAGLLFACKDTPEPSAPDCTLAYTEPASLLDTFFPISPCLLSTQYVRPERYHYQDACFNPLNSNQIAFMRLDQSVIPVRFELCTFDFCTGDLKVFTDKCFSGPDWSAKGWIAFRGKNKQIWIIKSDGDSLIQLTTNPLNHVTPRWNAAGEHLMFWEDNPYNNHVITNTNAERKDTIQNLFGSTFDWDGQKIIVTRSENGLEYYVNLFDYPELNSNRIETIPLNGTTDYIPYFVDINPTKNAVFWSNLYEINETDFSGHRRLVSRMTSANWYGRVSVSGDGQKLIVERTDRRRPEVCVIEERFRLYLMESDGTGERRIVFPE